MSAYCETCAAIANVFWNYRLFLLHGDSKYFSMFWSEHFIMDLFQVFRLMEVPSFIPIHWSRLDNIIASRGSDAPVVRRIYAASYRRFLAMYMQ